MPEVKCHYEMLGVSQDADDNELKKAYRKQALKWHPDKNPDKIEECTKYFALIQRAYDVLGDKQERAWYDKHREAILKGGFGKDYEDDFLDVMEYMTPTAYSGFGDDEDGYYTVYREVFLKIADEDLRYQDEESEEMEIPCFGDSQSSYEEVVHPFYAYWQSYRTARSFVWVEEYDTREAPNRRVARLIEKENKKKREAARKEWNQQVQLLVSYVRKKDKRVQAQKKVMEEKAAERKRLEAERREKERKERAREHEELAAEGQKAKEEMEAELRAMEATLNAEFGVDSEEQDSVSQDESLEEDFDDLFCVACNKNFKSAKAFANHENSKKHKENMSYLKAEMEAEEEEYGAEESEEEEGEIGKEELEEEEEEKEEVEKVKGENDGKSNTESDQELPLNNHYDQQRKKLSKKQKKKRRQQAKTEEPEMDDEGDGGIGKLSDAEDAGEDAIKPKLSKKQKKKKRQQAKAEEAEEDDLPEPTMKQNKDDNSDDIIPQGKLSKKQKKRRRQQKQFAEDEEDEKDADESVTSLENKNVSVDQVPETVDGDGEEHVNGDDLSAELQERLKITEEEQEEGSVTSKQQQSRKGKGKERKNNADNSQASAASEPQICHTCSAQFPTRNKLFKHVKTTGHALRLPDDGHTQQRTSSTKSSKKKKHKGRNDIE